MIDPSSDGAELVHRHGPLKLAGRVFYPVVIFILALVAATMLYPERLSTLFDDVLAAIVHYFGWYYVFVCAAFIGFCIWVGCSRFGQLRLGPDDSRPEFSRLSWYTMLFSAGSGIGVIFYGTAEPVAHFHNAPRELTSNTVEAARYAVHLTWMEWGGCPFAIYIVVGLALGFATHRRGRPLTIRWGLEPLFGRWVHGWVGDLIDIVAMIGTVFGLATSLGLGVMQINTGLDTLGIFDASLDLRITLIALISLAAGVSVLTGLSRGIKWLSQVNMWLTIVLLMFFFAWGPTQYLIVSLFEATVAYAANLITFTLYVESVPTEATRWSDMWQGWWTTFYWGWWISWAPFVGVFVARVSRGRTVREFILGVVGVSSLLSFVWIVAYGGTALWAELVGPGGVSDAVSANVSMALFATFEAMDVGAIGVVAGVLGTILVTTYFVTSSDSGTLVVATILSEGNEHPMYRHRVIWGSLEGIVAAVLLVAGGSAALSTLQTAAIIAALPFSLIMVLMAVAIIRCLSMEHLAEESERPRDAA